MFLVQTGEFGTRYQAVHKVARMPVFERLTGPMVWYGIALWGAVA